MPAQLGTSPKIGHGLAGLSPAAAAVPALVGGALAVGIFGERLFLLLLGLSLLLDFLEDFLLLFLMAAAPGALLLEPLVLQFFFPFHQPEALL